MGTFGRRVSQRRGIMIEEEGRTNVSVPSDTLHNFDLDQWTRSNGSKSTTSARGHSRTIFSYLLHVRLLKGWKVFYDCSTVQLAHFILNGAKFINYKNVHAR